MTEISSPLIKFNGAYGPQYLDEADKTDGPDGTMKPLTKEVLQSVSDDAVLSRLNEVLDVSGDVKLTGSTVELQTKTQLVDETGATIAQPIDLQYHNLKTDNPLPIIQAGKVVEEISKKQDVIVAAGTTSYVIPAGTTLVDNYKYVVCGVYTDSDESFSVQALYQPIAGMTFLTQTLQGAQGSSPKRFLTDRIGVKSSNMGIAISNEGVADLTCTVILLGVK